MAFDMRKMPLCGIELGFGVAKIALLNSDTFDDPRADER